MVSSINDTKRNFSKAVYDIVRLIPKGRVTSYGAIAKSLGATRSSRVVGWAMNKSHFLQPPVPAHRVVNRNGLLTGRAHFDPPEKMEELLKAEGISVKNNQVQDFEKYFWNPSEELDF